MRQQRSQGHWMMLKRTWKWAWKPMFGLCDYGNEKVCLWGNPHFVWVWGKCSLCVFKPSQQHTAVAGENEAVDGRWRFVTDCPPRSSTPSSVVFKCVSLLQAWFFCVCWWQMDFKVSGWCFRGAFVETIYFLKKCFTKTFISVFKGPEIIGSDHDEIRAHLGLCILTQLLRTLLWRNVALLSAHYVFRWQLWAVCCRFLSK